MWLVGAQQPPGARYDGAFAAKISQINFSKRSQLACPSAPCAVATLSQLTNWPSAGVLRCPRYARRRTAANRLAKWDAPIKSQYRESQRVQPSSQRPVGKPGEPTHRSAVATDCVRCVALAPTIHSAARFTTAVPTTTKRSVRFRCCQQRLLRLGILGPNSQLSQRLRQLRSGSQFACAVPLYQPTHFSVHFDTISNSIIRHCAQLLTD